MCSHYLNSLACIRGVKSGGYEQGSRLGSRAGAAGQGDWGHQEGAECNHREGKCSVLAGATLPVGTGGEGCCQASPVCSAAGGEEEAGPASL